MERFNKKAAATIDLQQRGYDLDFILNNESLFYTSNTGNRSHRMSLKLPKFHHFQARSGLKENYVICAATSVHQDLRGILMTSYRAFTKRMSFHLWFKLAPAFNLTHEQESVFIFRGCYLG